MTGEVLFDTDILSSVMSRDPRSFPHAEAYLRQHRAFTFSIITRYEILRGLKAKTAQVQLVAFERIFAPPAASRRYPRKSLRRRPTSTHTFTAQAS